MKNVRRDSVAVKLWCTVWVQAATTMTQIEPLQTPVRKQIELVISASTIDTMSSFSNRAHVSWDAITKPFPYAAIC